MARSFSSRRGRFALGAAVVLVLPLVVACNAIIGLSDFEKGECAGARCPDDGSFPDQLVEAGLDAQQDVRADVKGADPVSWAKWPMPNYVDAGPGQPLSSPALVATGNTVTDTVTKLVWRSTLAAGDPPVTEAEATCRALDDGLWRAPKRIELVSLLDYSRSTFIDRTKFTDLKNFKVWTTSEVRPFVAGKPDQAYWVVNFETGAVEPLAGNEAAKVLCVRAK
jgi:hypothetical protein